MNSSTKQESKPLLGNHPNTPVPNPSLSRDELGLIMAYHRKNVEDDIRMSPILTRGSVVPNHIALKALREKIVIRACNYSDCDAYDVHTRRMANYNYDQGAGCDCCLDHRSEDMQERIITCYSCNTCGDWFCRAHLMNLNTRENYGKNVMLSAICERCATEEGCPNCNMFSHNGTVCHNYVMAVRNHDKYHRFRATEWRCGLVKPSSDGAADNRDDESTDLDEPANRVDSIDSEEMSIHEALEATVPS